MTSEPINPIIAKWIEQLRSPDVQKLVETFGETRRIDLTLFSDRGFTNKPPRHTVT